MRHGGQLAILLVVSALANAAGAEEAADIRERLDAAVGGASEGGLAEAEDDAGFLRRLWLDVAGHVPPVLVVRDFLDDRDPKKREKAAAERLGSDDFAAQWGRVFATWLTGERPIARDGYDGRVLHTYLRDGLRKGESYGRLVRELIAGGGTSDASGPANFLLRYDVDAPRLAGAVGKNILGVTIQCAQCHDHPFARWRQDDFWALAASFTRLKRMEGDENLKAVVESKRGELTRPDPNAPPASNGDDIDDYDDADAPPPKQVVVRPRRLDGKALASNGRRQALADWVVARDNSDFARNLVNRVWGELFGRTLVANLDKVDPGSKAAGVLILLADDFAAHDHDVKRLLALILVSKSYGQASTAKAKPAWTRPGARPLSVDQLHASIAQATGYEGPAVEEKEDEDAPEAEDEEAEDEPLKMKGGDAHEENDEEEMPAGDRPVELLKERGLSLQRALVMLNGEYLKEATRSAVRVIRAAHGSKSGPGPLEWAFLGTLSRRPTVEERAILEPLLAKGAGARGVEDVFWVLLNSAEFQTNH